MQVGLDIKCWSKASVLKFASVRFDEPNQFNQRDEVCWTEGLVNVKLVKSYELNLFSMEWVWAFSSCSKSILSQLSCTITSFSMFLRALLRAMLLESMSAFTFSVSNRADSQPLPTPAFWLPMISTKESVLKTWPEPNYTFKAGDLKNKAHNH